MATDNHYIGLMSGTSMDGVDGVVMNDTCTQIIASSYLPYPAELKQRLRRLAKNSTITLKILAQLDTDVALIFAKTVRQLLQNSNIATADIADIQAIGSHGQTVFHQGGKYSTQIGHGAIIAENTGITTVADFRMADIAANGQGAPLTPLYHQHLLNGKDGIVINLGGITNLTKVSSAKIVGFDVGPANTLLDNWIQKYKQLDYDQGGVWARSGVVDEPLLKNLLADNYFQKAAPKSTGAEYFNLDWLASFLTGSESTADVQRTLVELSAVSISQHITKQATVYLCGGGVHNSLLFERLTHLNPHSKITTTDDLGVSPDFVEAAAFAFFAKQTLGGKAANLPAVTGAKGKRILGAIYLFKNQ